MDQVVVVSGVLQAGELAGFLRREQFRTNRLLYAVMPFLTIPLAILLYGTIPYIFGVEGNVWIAFISVAVPLASLGVGILLGLYRLSRFAKRMVAPGTELGGLITWEFGPDGVDAKTNMSTAQVSWEALTLAIEYDDLFILFRTNNICHFLPKQMFQTPDDIGSMRRRLQGKMGNEFKVA